MAKRKSTFPVQCSYCKRRDLPFLQAYEDAQRRMKAGQRQTKCPECGLYCWPDELPKAEAEGRDA